MHQAELSHPKYRSDIDGLRAIAVLAVVGYHAFPEWFSSGYVGVDIFFVISGYLISTIILENLQNGNFNFSVFYARRIKRIFPALLIVLIACYALGWIALLADEYKQLGKHIAGGAGFISNFLFWKESGYFDVASELKPLLHLWSLGIEEQFYILWPILLWMAWRLHFNLLTLLAIFIVISFGLNLDMLRSDSVGSFYLPFARFWELLIGSALAYLKVFNIQGIFFQNKDEHNFFAMNIISVVGFVLVTVGIFAIPIDALFPGWWVLMPVVGATLIISAGQEAFVNRILLSKRIFVWIGLISFPLYLWHWPLLSFARIIEGKSLPVDLRISLVLLAIVLSWLTYELVEKKIRLKSKSKIWPHILFILMCIVGLVGYNTFARNGLEFRLRKFAQISAAAGDWQYPGEMQSFEYQNKKFWQQKSEVKNTTLFIGDSNIEQYHARVDELIKKNPEQTKSVIFATGGGCIPIPNSKIESFKHCFDLLPKALELAFSRDDIQNVVIGGIWFSHLNADENSKSRRFYEENNVQYPIKKGSIGYQKAMLALSNYLGILKKHGKKVFLILNIPKGDKLDPKSMAVRSLKNFPNVMSIDVSGIQKSALMDRFNFINADLKEVAKNNNVIVIDPMDFLCNDDLCPSVDSKNEPIYKDSGHLRPRFVREYAKFIDATVLN